MTEQIEIRTVPGDMPDWTDDRKERPAAGGPVLTHALASVLPGTRHALVTGPHDTDLLDLVVASAGHTTLLLRGHVDALAAAERYRGKPVEVVCGDLEGLSPVDADLVLALDGVGRLTSINVEARTWRRSVDLLLAAAPGARLVLGVENPLGLRRITDAAPATADDPSAWRPYDAADATTPASAVEAGEALDGAEVWAARPTLARPTLLTRAGVETPVALEVAAQPRSVGRGDLRNAVEALAARGRTDAIAAGWILVRGASVAGDVVVERTGDGVTRTAADLAPGTLLESALLDACLRRDQPRIHDLVRSWVAALDGGGAEWSSATADNVHLAPHGALSVLDAGSLTGDGVATERVGHHLADFANRLSDLGFRHPWPAAAGAAEITAYLLALVGRSVEADEAARLVEAARSSAAQRPSTGAVPAELARERFENDALRSKVRWFESALRQREATIATLRVERDDPRPRLQRRVRDLEAELAALRESASFRAGRMLTAPARRLRAARKS